MISLGNKIRWNTADRTYAFLEFKVGSGPWQYYRLSPHAKPDYVISNGSKGFSTAQALLKLGYVYEAPKSID